MYYRKKLLLAQLNHTLKTLSQEKDAVLSFIREIGDAMTSARELDELCRLVITPLRRTIGASSEAIFLLNDDHTHLQAQFVDGLFPPFFESIPAESLSKLATKAKYIQDLIKNLVIPLGEGIVGRVAQARTPVLVRNALSDASIPQPPIDFLKVTTLMAVPLMIKDEMIGVLVAANKNEEQFFNETDLSILEAIADQIAVSIHNARLYRELAEKDRIDRELQLATQVQQLLQPAHYPKIAGFDFAGVSKPALEIGGDYFDFFPIGNGRYAIAIADVSGKGIPAAMVMTMARSILRASSRNQDSPRHVLSELNRILVSDIQQEMFISMACMILDEKNKKLLLTRAGHEPILLYDRLETKIKMLRPQGIVLGMDPGPLFTSTLEEVLLAPQAGDVLVLYTDGVTEAQDSEGREFGYEALSEAIHSAAAGSAKEIAGNVMARIARFTGDLPQKDDMTLVIVKVV